MMSPYVSMRWLLSVLFLPASACFIDGVCPQAFSPSSGRDNRLSKCPDISSVFFHDRGWWRQISSTTTRSPCQGRRILLEAPCVLFSEQESLAAHHLWGPKATCWTRDHISAALLTLSCPPASFPCSCWQPLGLGSCWIQKQKKAQSLELGCLSAKNNVSRHVLIPLFTDDVNVFKRRRSLSHPAHQLGLCLGTIWSSGLNSTHNKVDL